MHSTRTAQFLLAVVAILGVLACARANTQRAERGERLERDLQRLEEDIKSLEEGDNADDEVALGEGAQKWEPCACTTQRRGKYKPWALTIDRCQTWGRSYQWCYIRGGRDCTEYQVHNDNGHYWRKCDSSAVKLAKKVSRSLNTAKAKVVSTHKAFKQGAKTAWDHTRRITSDQTENSDPAMQCGPERDIKTHSCGPEVGHNVRLTMRNMHREWNVMRTVEKVGRCSALVSMLEDGTKKANGAWDAVAINAWDFGDFAYIKWDRPRNYAGSYIEKFFQCGKGGINNDYSCLGTLAVDGKCHHNSAINYCLWGMLMSLCGRLHALDHVPGWYRGAWRKVRNGFGHMLSTGYKLASSAASGKLQPFLGDVANMATQCRDFGDQLKSEGEEKARLEFPETNYKYWQCRNTCPPMDFVAKGATAKVKWYLGGSKLFMRPNPPIIDLAVNRKKLQEALNEALPRQKKYGAQWREKTLEFTRRLARKMTPPQDPEEFYLTKQVKMLINYMQVHKLKELPTTFKPYMQVQGKCLCYTQVRVTRVQYTGNDLGNDVTLGARVTGFGPMEDSTSPSGLGHKLNHKVKLDVHKSLTGKALTCRPILWEGYRPCGAHKIRIHARFEIDNAGTNPTSKWAYTDVKVDSCPAKDSKKKHSVTAHATEWGKTALAHFHFEVTSGQRLRDSFPSDEHDVGDTRQWYAAYHAGDTPGSIDDS